MKVIKKILNIFIIAAAVVFILLCVDVVFNKLANTSYDDLNSADKEALAEICDIDNLFDSRKGNDDIWDKNYNLSDADCVISRKYGLLKGYSYVINADMSGNIFAQKIEMPTLYKDISVYRFSFFAPQMIPVLFASQDSGYLNVGGEVLYSFRYDTSTVKYNGSGSLEEAYVKETFEMQLRTPDAPTLKSDEKTGFELTEENVALTGLQYRIIDEMLNAKSIDDLNELIAEYVLVREYQAEKYPAFENYREKTELFDGRTQHVFYNVSDELKHYITYFNKEKSDAITFYSAYYYLCTGRYNSDVHEYFDYTGNVYVGAALCEILNEKSICANWRSKLDNSSDSDFTSPYTLIKNYCGGACSEYSDKTVEDIMEAYNYEEITEMAKALMEGSSDGNEE